MREFKKNVWYQTLYQILTTCLPLITSPYLARSLGAEKQGIFSYTYSIVNWFMLIALLGVTNYGTREIAACGENKEKRGIVFGEIYTIQFLSSLLMIIVYAAYLSLMCKENITIAALQSFYLLSAATDIRREVGEGAICHLAQDLPRRVDPQPEPTVRPAEELRVIFLSRVSRTKNLKFALEILRDVRAQIAFDIYGVREDAAYYEECRRLAEELPPNVRVSWYGEVQPNDVPATFARHQVFLFPTMGENYGHVIYEAITGGCIPVISDQTPWGMLETEGFGRVIPIGDRAGFAAALEQLAALPPEELLSWQRRAADFAMRYSAGVSCDGYREIFDREKKP